jgi:hypothetical protein
MKYVKYDANIEPYSLFGNFELINVEAKRDLTTRCETEKCIVLCINKKSYSSAIYNAQKEKRDKEIELIHSCHLFKNISKRYFKRKIYSTFQINNFFKDNILFRQNENLTHFIFIKEGTIELSLQNMSFVEFHRLIKDVRETLIKKAKECKINLKELFDFDTKVDSKSNYNMNTIREILNQKQTFLFQRNEKGIFGDYEFKTKDKKKGLICEPFLSKIKIDLNMPNQFLILASDGIWDLINEKEIQQMIAMKTNSEKLCAIIIKKALDRDSWDNMSVFAIKLT